MSEAKPDAGGDRGTVDFRTDPSRYRHWKVSVDGRVATLSLDVREDGGLRPGYELKLNSYDLGVDIELYDAIQRLRFEHPEVKALVITADLDRVFCSGANIYMLGLSTHSFKVNFCKFTNETRLYLEDASANSGLGSLCACKGTTAGGGSGGVFIRFEMMYFPRSTGEVRVATAVMARMLPWPSRPRRFGSAIGTRRNLEPYTPVMP